MVQIIDIITSVISLFLVITNGKKLGHGARYLVFYIFFVFYGLPLVLDSFIQMADYTYSYGYYGFDISQNDEATRIIYDIFIIYTQLIILYYPKRTQRDYTPICAPKMVLSSHTILALCFFTIVPSLGVLILMRRPEILHSFQWRELELFNAVGSYSTIEKFSYLGVTCSCILLFNGRKGFQNIILKCFGLAFTYVNVCIQGKRAILFFAIIVFFILLFYSYSSHINNKKQARRIAFISLLIVSVASVGMVFFSLTVKMGRGYSETATDIFYTTTRVDFLRDDRVRMAIYAETHPDKMKILDYPGQSFLSDISAIVPVNYLVAFMELEPYSYQTHFTYALTKEPKPENGRLVVDGNSWMTVCFISELLSNLSFLGFILIPFFFLTFSSWIDRSLYPYNALLTCGLTLLNMFDFTYIVLYLEVVLVLLLINKHRTKINIPNANTINRSSAN